ncbi:uncharacterized protein LOC101457304 [Ceratitis capitata]|uniref:(Mediterranean fruit fly) hypothetical protein n=1 Tax=Ceratitis capitata TaxID=7213 RepID=W8BXX5_CERCA|nr:uncharacterized protein LOC101457304 [Ceratitis capitata]CAD7005623.1 unnamed protein product [Ceratitis capitata]
MATIRKLDDQQIAYLVGETKFQVKPQPPELQQHSADSNEHVLEEFFNAPRKAGRTITRNDLEIFKSIKSVRVLLEALTLKPEGSKRIELLQQNNAFPIFTIECQLSKELVQYLPRNEIFNIIQFESDQFHCQTQCTRFGREAQRNINLKPLIEDLDENASGGESSLNLGRLHFAVRWREPGTCLNELLGFGVLELRDLLKDALLEQCKCVTIHRRGVPLATVYVKVNLSLEGTTVTTPTNTGASTAKCLRCS